MFDDYSPLEVNDHYMQFIGSSGIFKLSQIIAQPSLCVCIDLQYDCHINNLGYLYPGQNLTIPLHYKKTVNVVAVKADITQQNVTPCTVLDISETLQPIYNQCSKLHYTQ